MDKQLKALDTLMKALADPTRLRILGLLATGEVCVCHIHESLKITQPKASRHLGYLRRAGLVDTRRDGLWVHYRLANRSTPAIAAVEHAVWHALTHSPAVRRDLVHLHKQNSCSIPKSADAAQGACCETPAMPISLTMRG